MLFKDHRKLRSMIGRCRVQGYLVFGYAHGKGGNNHWQEECNVQRSPALHKSIQEVQGEPECRERKREKDVDPPGK